MKKWFAVLLMIFLWTSGALAIDHAQTIRDRLAWLNQIPEIEWVEFEQNQVFIGWKEVPENFVELNKKAAINGNEAIAFPVHVWSTKAKVLRWRPGFGPYICETTARDGEIIHSSCEKRLKAKVSGNS